MANCWFFEEMLISSKCNVCPNKCIRNKIEWNSTGNWYLFKVDSNNYYINSKNYYNNEWEEIAKEKQRSEINRKTEKSISKWIDSEKANHWLSMNALFWWHYILRCLCVMSITHLRHSAHIKIDNLWQLQCKGSIKIKPNWLNAISNTFYGKWSFSPPKKNCS